MRRGAGGPCVGRRVALKLLSGDAKDAEKKDDDKKKDEATPQTPSSLPKVDTNIVNVDAVRVAQAIDNLP